MSRWRGRMPVAAVALAVTLAGRVERIGTVPKDAWLVESLR
jgi:hypothetical protein